MGGLVKKLYSASIFLLIVGGMAWGYLGMRGKNPVSQVLGKYAGIVYGLVGISAVIVLLVGRNAFLPFLGPTVFPCAALEDKTPENADTFVEVYVRPGAKVLFWAAEPATDSLKTLKMWKEAYNRYENVGVTTADETGKAVLKVRKPQPYKVPLKGRLESHIHYRICAENGWMSQVETHVLFSEPFVNLQNLEAFQSTPPPVPLPEPSVKPVVASTPELPVVADPVSGIPTAVPAFANAPTVQSTSSYEGFSNEPIFSASTGPTASLGGVDAEDPRLLRLRSSIEVDALKVDDSMGYKEGIHTFGTELDAAFQPTLKPSAAPARAMTF